MINVTLKDFG